jgi:hypothetical protein
MRFVLGKFRTFFYKNHPVVVLKCEFSSCKTANSLINGVNDSCNHIIRPFPGVRNKKTSGTTE